MPIDVTQFTELLQPERTVLLFGAGASLPSGAPSVADLQAFFERKFGVPVSDYTLPEQTGVIEARLKDRSRLIAALREKFANVKPTGAILNLPLYEWKSIYTTNYDLIIEESYKRKDRAIVQYSCNFDFSQSFDPSAVQYFKIHGTINKDESDGHRSRIILTAKDYDLTNEYRQGLYKKLQGDLFGSHLVIIGHSLADKDVKEIVDEANQLNRTAGGAGTITLFIYTRDEGRAEVFEDRGINVCFGGLDDLFAGLARRINATPTMPSTGDPLDQHVALRPATIDVAHSIANIASNVSAMFNGRPASYSDIGSGLTFRRDLADMVVLQLRARVLPIAVILGPSGVGKTTAARQCLFELRNAGFLCWEHKADQVLVSHHWRSLAKGLQKSETDACLLVDDAHLDLGEVNSLVDDLAADGSTRCRLLLVSSRNHWLPRVKSPALNKRSHEYHLTKVHGAEIDRLLNLIEQAAAIRQLVGGRFAGFSRTERRVRLVERCQAEMFVCLKNIFATDKFDDIILREYASLKTGVQDVYKLVAAMEYAGVRVHRQMIIRLLGIHADRVSNVLADLEDIIHEETVSERRGIYAWYGRHKIIMGIIADHKYYFENSRYELFYSVISNIQPAYDIELRTIRELCNVETGLATIADKRKQNVLLRKMLSVAPGERVPRHRLIRNLIALQEYDEADTELRLFEREFRLDGPASRYKIEAATNRALDTEGILEEDRIVLLRKAQATATALVQKHQYNKAVLTAYCELGVALARLTDETSVFDHGLTLLKAAERQTGDSDITTIVVRLERKLDRFRATGEIGEAMIDEADLVPIE